MIGGSREPLGIATRAGARIVVATTTQRKQARRRLAAVRYGRVAAGNVRHPIGVRMTATLSTLALLRAGRAREIHALGARPTWNPFRRRAWDRKRKAIGEYWCAAALEVARDEMWLTPAMEMRMREGWL